jgi:hypothetical protein
MPTMLRDFVFAFRQLRKHHVYALTGILSMALGIGATAAVYSVLYGVLVDPYPYKEADRIALIDILDKQGREGSLGFTLAEADQLRRGRSVADVVAEQTINMTVSGGELPEPAKGLE